MIKRFVILRRKDGMTHQEFCEHWEKIHAPLVVKVPGILKYVQYHVKSEKHDEFDEDIDGIAELWFESEEAKAKAYQTPEYQAVLQDGASFMGSNRHFVHGVVAEKIIQFLG